MHDQERSVEPDEQRPEVPLTERAVEHASGDLREPVVNAGEDREHAAAEQHVMEVGHHVVGLV